MRFAIWNLGMRIYHDGIRSLLFSLIRSKSWPIPRSLSP
jgi:hypothetical protein